MGREGVIRFIDIAPRFFVADLRAAIAHYENLEFEIVDVFEETYATMRHGDVEIHLSRREGTQPSEAYIWVEDVESLIGKLRERGVALDGPHDRIYGLREIVVADAWKNVLTFGETITAR